MGQVCNDTFSIRNRVGIDMAARSYALRTHCSAADRANVALSLLMIADDAALNGDKAGAIEAIAALMDYMDEVEAAHAEERELVLAAEWLALIRDPFRPG